MEPIRCIHPAFVTHVPPRARAVRESLVRTETTVRLRRWDEGYPGRGFHVGPSGLFSAARELMTARDGYWERLYGTDGRFVLHEDIRAYLAGEPQTQSMRDALGFHFAGTPVAAHAGGTDWTGQDERGADPGERGLGDVRTDGRAEASTALQRWLDGNVALHSGSVFLRARPVAVSTELHQGGGGPWRIHARRQPHSWNLVAAGAEAYPRLKDERPAVDVNYSGDMVLWLRSAEERLDPEADLAYMLNAHAGPVLAELNRSILKGARDHDDQVMLVGLRDALAPVARRARLGLAGTVDLPREAEALCRATEGAERFPPTPANRYRLARLHGILRAHVAPRVAALLDAGTPGEDLAAIEGLAP